MVRIRVDRDRYPHFGRLLQYPLRRVEIAGLILVKAPRIHLQDSGCRGKHFQRMKYLFLVPSCLFIEKTFIPVVNFDLIDMAQYVGWRSLQHFTDQAIVALDEQPDVPVKYLSQPALEHCCGSIDFKMSAITKLVNKMDRANGIIEWQTTYKATLW